jgi:hypothetical protein
MTRELYEILAEAFDALASHLNDDRISDLLRAAAAEARAGGTPMQTPTSPGLASDIPPVES